MRRAMTKLQVDILTDEEQELLDRGRVWINGEAITALADLSDGDARCALNGLQLAVQTKKTSLNELLGKPKSNTLKKGSSLETLDSVSDITKEDSDAAAKLSVITLQDIKICLQKTHLLYDRVGDEHYHSISALHKSMRGSDASASLYWLARMLCAGEDPLYIARRIVRFASEDVGMYNEEGEISLKKLKHSALG